MRIGVYLGHGSLDTLGGMGVYLQNLLRGVESCGPCGHELALLVDEVHVAAARQLGLRAEIVTMQRPTWGEIPQSERRDVIAVRRRSYRSAATMDCREGDWSAAARAYLWGLDDAVATAAIDLLYFSMPPYLKWPRVPMMLTVHDLKHMHRPEDHASADLARRRRWRRVAQRASLVYASYEHIRSDIIRFFHVSPEKTAVLPLACPTDGFEPALNPKLPCDVDVSRPFALMPAQFWPHKNHRRVIEAVARLRIGHQIDVRILCTGQTQGECATHAIEMARYAAEARVDDLVQQIGFVDRQTLRALYDRARFVLVATLYDPGSFPAMEALAMGKPLAASNVTSIPETVGDAAVLFDPTRVDEIADALGRLWTDEALCRSLAQRGPKMLQPRSWSDVGRDWLRLCEKALARSDVPQEAVA